MPRKCTACSHPQIDDINKEIVRLQSYRDIAKRYGLTAASIYRHRCEHMADALFAAERLRQGNGIREELERVYQHINRMLEACDTWLRDPDNPEKYSLEPRAEEIRVIYREIDEEGNYGGKRTAWMSELILRLEDEKNYLVMSTETKRADPRKLIIDTVNSLKGQLELAAALMGDMPKNDITLLINNPKFVQLQTVIMEQIGTNPDVRQQLLEAFARMDG